MVDDRYLDLISEVKTYYEREAPELRNIRNNKILFDFIWCNGLISEINLWNYWQGMGQDKAKIMIVGQDFGGCADPFYRECIESAKSAKEISQKYIDYISKGKSPTDRNLIKITGHNLGEDYSAGKAGNNNLFMTNLCLGYRTGEGISGGDVSAQLRHDSVYLKKLIGIKRPEIVICLGAETYMAALTGLILTKKHEEYSQYFNRINVDFWSLLDSGDNMLELAEEGHKYRIFGVAHTGSNGMINRKRLSKKYKASQKSSEDLMNEDWKRIREYI